MKTLIALQLKKNIAGFAAMAIFILASVPLIPHLFDTVPWEKFQMGLIGLPLMLLFYSGRCGSQAAESSTMNTEQLLPVSQYKLLLSSLVSLLMQAGTLLVILNIMFMLTPVPTDRKRWFMSLIREFPYYLVMLQVVLSGFAFSFALKNGIAGGVLAGIAIVCAGYPLTYLHDYNLSYPRENTLLLLYLIPIVASISSVTAIKLLSGVSDRKEKKNYLKLALIAVLLIAGPLISYSCLAAFNLAARSRIAPIAPTYIEIPAGISIPATDLKTGYSQTALLMRPYTGEIFFIDKTGKNNVIVPGKTEYTGLLYFKPIRHDRIYQALMNPNGDIWLLRLNRSNMHTELLNGSAKSGLTLYAVLNRTRDIWLLGGKTPVILKLERDRAGAHQHYRCELPGKGIVDCKKDSTPATL